jgi:predicted Ser/Thr protein kinase
MPKLTKPQAKALRALNRHGRSIILDDDGRAYVYDYDRAMLRISRRTLASLVRRGLIVATRFELPTGGPQC